MYIHITQALTHTIKKGIIPCLAERDLTDSGLDEWGQMCWEVGWIAGGPYFGQHLGSSVAYPTDMGSLPKCTRSRWGVAAILTNGTGCDLSECDLAEQTPGVAERVVSWFS